MGVAWPTGATPPMAKPVRSRTKSAFALPIGSPTTAARRAVSTRRAPDDMTSTAPSVRSVRNTSELAICATSQPRNAAAASAVRAAPGSSTIGEAMPAAWSAVRTLSTPGLVSTADITKLYRSGQYNHRMELLASFWEIVMHLDVHLAAFVAEHGAWVYALMFTIVFI